MNTTKEAALSVALRGTQNESNPKSCRGQAQIFLSTPWRVLLLNRAPSLAPLLCVPGSLKMTLPATSNVYSATQLRELAASVEFWWHSIDLGHGVVTNGVKTPELLRHEYESLHLPSLQGKSVLDIGAFDGFFSFAAERNGARRVVALDHYVWSLDLPRHIQYWRDCKERGVVPLPNEQTPHWQPARLPGKLGFDTAHRVLGSKVETVIGDFMTMDLQPLGQFDIVLYLGVLYHMENPLGSLQRLARLTANLAVIETHAVAIPGYEHLELCEFYSSNQLNGDVSNWWGPNLKALEGMCRAAGFSRVQVVSVPRTTARQIVRSALHRVGVGRNRTRYLRVTLHAWK
jgi:tRNA (mo5U34)-methyltransferase